jgi:hypothetical protein
MHRATARGLGFLLAGEPPEWSTSTGQPGSFLVGRSATGRYGRWLNAMHAELARLGKRRNSGTASR